MARLKVEYGIDLGTTNSALARIENGISTILEIDNSKTVPSCVAYNRKGTPRTGITAKNELANPAYRCHIEFKRRMGLETLENSPQHTLPDGKGVELTPEILSSEVLKYLKQRVNDEVFSAVTITVPALFETTQIEATKRAARLAGFDQIEILMEPVAASFCYALNHPGESGKWLVFDFGGGTFDSSIVEVDGGVMKVVSSEGDNRLGGKDLDNAIVKEILLPYIEEKYNISSLSESDKDLLLARIKSLADTLKIQLSRSEEIDYLSDLGQFGDDANGEEIEIEHIFTRKEFNKCYTPHIQKAIDLSKKLLKRNNLSTSDISTIILVGGPTQIPHFRTMISEQLIVPATDINPMTAVAEGAAIYASNIKNETSDHGKSLLAIENEEHLEVIDIEVGYESSTADELTPVSIVCKDKSKKLTAKLTRKDGWVSSTSELDAVFELQVVDGVNNFKIEVFDEKNTVVNVNVKELNINKGFSGGETSTQLHHGIGVRSHIKKRMVFTPLKGLEIDTPLPAVGLTKPVGDLFTGSELRPGNSNDKMNVLLYLAEAEADGHRVNTTRYSGVDFSITGEDVSQLIKAQSLVHFTLYVDRNQSYKMEIEFPESGEFIEKEVFDIPPLPEKSIGDINDLLNVVDTVILDAKNSSPSPTNLVDFTNERDGIKSRINSGIKGDELEQVYKQLQQLLLKIDIAVDNLEWPKLYEEIYKALNSLEDLVRECRDKNLQGHEQDQRDYESLKEKYHQLKDSKNVELGQSLLDDINSRAFRISDRHAGKEMAISYLRSLNSSFTSIDWTDVSLARMEVDKGMNLIQTGASESEIKSQLSRIINLMKNPDFDGGGGSVVQ